jgi:predicted acylesterase/phospholipase RssA
MGADVVIAVDVSWFGQARTRNPDEMARYGRSERYVRYGDELDEADVVIVPRTAPTRMLDFDNKQSNIAAGEAAGREAMPLLREALARAATSRQSRLRAPASSSNRQN